MKGLFENDAAYKGWEPRVPKESWMEWMGVGMSEILNEDRLRGGEEVMPEKWIIS